MCLKILLFIGMVAGKVIKVQTRGNRKNVTPTRRQTTLYKAERKSEPRRRNPCHVIKRNRKAKRRHWFYACKQERNISKFLP